LPPLPYSEGKKRIIQNANFQGEIHLFHKLGFAILPFLSIGLAAQAPSAPGKPLPPGPAQAKIKAACTQCHNVSRITEQHLSRDQWSTELEKMEGLGASVPDTDRTVILSYLVKNFGPQKGGSKTSTKKPNGAAN
jgi:hypothetical protein